MFAEAGQKLLYAAPYTPTGIWADRALEDLAAFEGLKIRTYDAAGVEVLSQVGAAPIQLSWADTVPQLTTGGIDAVLTSDESGIAGSLWEHLSHFNVVPYSVAINMTHMNLDVFESLTTEQQDAVEGAAQAAEEAAWQRAAERVASNAEVLDAEGVSRGDTVGRAGRRSCRRRATRFWPAGWRRWGRAARRSWPTTARRSGPSRAPAAAQRLAPAAGPQRPAPAASPAADPAARPA